MKYKEKGYNRLLVDEQYGWSEFEKPLMEGNSPDRKTAEV